MHMHLSEVHVKYERILSVWRCYIFLVFIQYVALSDTFNQAMGPRLHIYAGVQPSYRFSCT